MAGLGLSDAVSGYQEGVNWKLKNDESQRQAGIQKSLDAANQVAAETVKTAEAEDLGTQRRDWLAGGGDNNTFTPKPFVPADSLKLKVAQDRGTALMRAGLMDQAAQNEASVQAQRMRVRQGALERFSIDRDHAKLATAINDTIAGSKSITEATTVEGAPALNVGSTNMPAQPTKLQLKLSDGTSHSVTPQEIEDMALRLSDPQHAAHEAAMNLVRLKESLHTNREMAVEGVKSDNAVRLEGVKGKNKLGEIDRTHAGNLEVHSLDNEAHGLRTDSENTTRLGVAGVNSGATLGAASTAASARIEGATIAGAAHVKGAQITADSRGTKSSNAVKATSELNALVTKTIGQQMQGPLGGTRIGSEETMGIANLAQAAIDQAKSRGQILDPGIAVSGAIDRWRKSGKKPMPGESLKSLSNRIQKAPEDAAAAENE